MKGRWERGAKMKMLDFFFNSQLYQLKIKVLDQPIQTQEARVSLGHIQDREHEYLVDHGSHSSRVSTTLGAVLRFLPAASAPNAGPWTKPGHWAPSSLSSAPATQVPPSRPFTL